MNELNNNHLQILTDAIKTGILDLGAVNQEIMKQKRKSILSNHPYKIWYGSDGRWHSYLPDPSKKGGRKPIAKQSREALETEITKYYIKLDSEKSKEHITLMDLYPEWIEYKRLHTNASTYITRIQTDWNTYYKDTSIISIPLKQLDVLTLDMWAHQLIKTYEMTKNKYYNVTVIMRQSLNYAVKKGIIASNPLEKVKIDGKRMFQKAKKKPNETQIFFKTEEREISQLAWSDFNNKVKFYQLAPLAIVFQFQTGLRVGELCTLRYEDIESQTFIHVRRMIRRDTKEVVAHTKTECGDRSVYLTHQAISIIEAAKQRQHELGADTNGYIFSLTGDPIPERSITDAYRKYCKQIGIQPKSSHKARKTYISKLIEGGVSINTVREMAGHADERTTLKNYCFDTHTLEEKGHMIQKALEN